MIPDAPGLFGAQRKHDIHTGIDLYCPLQTKVIAIEDGVVMDIVNFTGPKVNTPWWNDTQAMFIEGKLGVFCYGEVTPLVKVGNTVTTGQHIADITISVLTKFKQRPMVMLHLEFLDHSCYTPLDWFNSEQRPSSLKDPLEILKQIDPTYSTFSLEKTPILPLCDQRFMPQ